MEQLTDVRHMKGEELSHWLHKKGHDFAKLDKDWFWMQEAKKILQAELTLQFEKNHGVTKAQSMARVDKKFKDHIEQMTDVLEKRNLAKVEYEEIQTEIRRRLNAQYAANQEFRAGRTHA